MDAFVRRVVALCAVLLVAGCVGLVPRDADESASDAREAGWTGDADAPPPVTLPPPAAASSSDSASQAQRPDLATWQQADVRARVDASMELASIDRRFYGMNVADWNPDDYHPETDAAFLAFLRALEPGVLRWPAGHTSQSWVWQGSADDDDDAERVLSAAHVDSFVRLCREVGAEPLLTVNVKTGTAEAAADLVRYVNVERGHGVTWWQIGNEPDHRDGLTSGPEEYVDQYNEFAAAMRAVDPSIKLVGAELMTGAHVLGSNGARDWLTPILDGTNSDMDAISWHYYPLDSNQELEESSARPSLENLLQQRAPDWLPSGLTFPDIIFPYLKDVRDERAPHAELWITEMAEDSADGGAEGLVGTTGAAAWTADALGRFAAHGPDALVKFVFKSGSGHRFTLLDEDMQPRPAYYAYWLYARHFGDEIVSAQTDDVQHVAAHAALRDDGALAVVLVNKADGTRTVAVDVEGHDASHVDRYTFAGDGAYDHSGSINGQRLTTENVGRADAVAPDAAELDEAIELPAYSVTLLVVR